MDLSMVPYKGSEEPVEVGLEEKNGKVGGGGMAAAGLAPGVRYWECMKNHAAGLGAQAFDGCGEFMPGGERGSLEALKCAACGCHRNFHRKEDCGGSGGEYVPYDHAHPRHHPLLLYNAPETKSPKFPSFFRHPLPPMLPLTAHPYRHLPFTATPSGMVPPMEGSRGSETPPPPPQSHGMAPDMAAARERERSRKRFRTKFTQEQKEEMQKFAEKVGWRIQRHDNDELQEFCTKVGVKRQVLKVWMHNNKSALSGGSAGRAADPTKGDPSAPAIRV